jgi:hypothetical protein
MKNQNILSKILAIVGTVWVWIPFAAPILFSIISLLSDGKFRFDYLMPAELFLFALAGGALLVWAAIRIKAHLKLVAWGLVIAIALMVGSQGIAVLTGLAKGKIQANGWQFVLVLGMIIASYVGIILVGIGGIQIVRDLFSKNGTGANQPD